MQSRRNRISTVAVKYKWKLYQAFVFNAHVQSSTTVGTSHVINYYLFGPWSIRDASPRLSLTLAFKNTPGSRQVLSVNFRCEQTRGRTAHIDGHESSSDVKFMVTRRTAKSNHGNRSADKGVGGDKKRNRNEKDAIAWLRRIKNRRFRRDCNTFWSPFDKVISKRNDRSSAFESRRVDIHSVFWCFHAGSRWIH